MRELTIWDRLQCLGNYYRSKYMRWNARRLERKGYNLLNIAHLDGMPAEDHDLIEKRANEILERSRRIRLNSYRF